MWHSVACDDLTPQAQVFLSLTAPGKPVLEFYLLLKLLCLHTCSHAYFLANKASIYVKRRFISALQLSRLVQLSYTSARMSISFLCIPFHWYKKSEKGAVSAFPFGCICVVTYVSSPLYAMSKTVR